MHTAKQKQKLTKLDQAIHVYKPNQEESFLERIVKAGRDKKDKIRAHIEFNEGWKSTLATKYKDEDGMVHRLEERKTFS